MSLHANNEETEAQVHRQRVTSTIASFVIGGLVVALLMLIMALILLSPIFRETPTIVTYQSPNSQDEQPDPAKRLTQQRSKPSAPSSAMARVIAANTTSPTAIPIPEIDVDAVSETFGTGDDFGDGWGFGDGGDGWGGGGTTFFQQKVRAQRVAYVIDYSASMKGQGRESLMRAELKKSVEKLTPGMQYQLIFFAGPAWTAGDTVNMNGKKSAVVKSGKDNYQWTSARQKANDWLPRGKKQQPGWVNVEGSNKKNSLKIIQTQKLVWGTHWEPPLEMAMSMDPAPQVIFFMTDGVTGGDVVQVARTIGAKAKSKDIIINTVAMMEPRAETAMKELAKRTGGQFTIVQKGGKVKLVPLR
jgi:hypothetical protein